MKHYIGLLLLITIMLCNCSKVESEQTIKDISQTPIKIGLTKVFNNLIYNGLDTTSTIDTVSIIGKYKEYFIEETKHGSWTGLSLIKYYDHKYIIGGIIENNDTTIFKKPYIMGFLDSEIGYKDKQIIKKQNLKCKDSLYVNIIPEFKILDKIDTVYSQYYTSTCPAVSHRYDYYSKEYGLVYNKAIERNKDRICQEIILEQIYYEK